MFRLLRADEIECRISQCNQYGVGLLLYKDARCDQNILDETVGAKNWMRHHTRDNANCIVAIWDEDKKQWIEKEDTGTESYTEAEKGLASDSFKRACFNWGIGRELYTAPNMFVRANQLKTLKQEEVKGKTKWTCSDYFKVDAIEYVDRKLVYVRIVNLKNDAVIEFGQPAKEATQQKDTENSVIDDVKKKVLRDKMTEKGITAEQVESRYGAIETMSMKNWMKAMQALEKSTGA